MTDTRRLDGPSGLDLTALAGFLTTAVPGLPVGPLNAELVSGGKSNLTYRITDGTHRWILRRPPLGMVLATAHDMSREYRVMSGLAGSAVPVPQMVAICDTSEVIGAPFYVMAEVDGIVYREPAQVAELTPAQNLRLGNALVDTLADLHEVDVDDVGLADLGRPAGYLGRQLTRWIGQYEAAKVREQPDIVRLGAALTRSCPARQVVRIVHGDYRIDNVMVDRRDPGTIIAVLDWEMATLGDPLADLGILVSFWDEPGRDPNPVTNGLTAFEGFPSPSEVVARYAERRRLDPDEVADIDWYIVFGLWKVAIILEQIHVRHSQGQTLGEGFDGVGDKVALLVHRALEVAASSTSSSLRTLRSS